MNIGIYIENYIAGGVETVIANKIRSWPEKQDSFIIFANKDNEGIAKILSQIDGVDVTIQPISILSVPSLMRKYGTVTGLVWLIGIYLRHLFVLLNTFRLIKIFKNFQLDVLFIHNGGYPGGFSCFSANIAAKWLGIKRLYYVIHNLAAKKRIWQFPFDVIYDSLIMQSTKLIFVSNASRLVMQQNRGFGKNGEVIYNGVEPCKYNRKVYKKTSKVKKICANKALFKVAMVGRFDKSKGHKVLFEALEKLEYRSPKKFELHLFGSKLGEDAINLKQMTAKHNIDNAVHNHGFVPNVREFLTKMDCLVFPSVSYESLPMSIIEAMSIKLPIIASDVGGIKEIIRDKIDGIILPPSDSDVLSESIASLSSDQSFADFLTENAYERYRNIFTSHTMAQEYYKRSRSH